MTTRIIVAALVDLFDAIEALEAENCLEEEPKFIGTSGEYELVEFVLDEDTLPYYVFIIILDEHAEGFYKICD